MAEIHCKTAKTEIIPENEMKMLREFLSTTTIRKGFVIIDLGNEFVSIDSDNSGAKEF
jgi:hypothetical protein